MSTHRSVTRFIKRTGTAAALLAMTPALVANADSANGRDDPRLAGRAVLPVETYAPGPPSGAAFGNTVIRGIQFPTPSQPVEGFSGVVAGSQPGTYLATTDNGFGTKANSADFLIRAYELTPDFKTAKGGSGEITVGDFVQFADPDGVIGFPIVRVATDRMLTGADIDPESIQRDHRGDLWLGDEFGPWILHFDSTGRLLAPPIALPDDLRSPNNPAGANGVANSRGIEAMAISPNGRWLTVVLEGAVAGDDPFVRRIYRYDTVTGDFERLADYRVDVAGHMVADAQALDQHRLLVLERDGVAAVDRHAYTVDTNDVAADGSAAKTELLDLAAIPDPDLVSLPEIHPGDVGIGDPFRVMCESSEAIYVVSHAEVLIGCDNNFPNAGRNPGLADDNEFIVVKAPGL